MNATAPAALPLPVTASNDDWSYPAYGNPKNNSNTSLNSLHHTFNANPKGFPDTPPISSGHNSTSTTDGAMQNGTRKANPSPPSSVTRGSIDSRSVAGSIDSRRAYMMEEALSEHYKVLKTYLAPYLGAETSEQRQNRARDKLLRLTSIQFQELSADVYDELLRREDEKHGAGAPKYLLPKQNFHPKRNQARQKLSTLPTDRFRQLATDVFFELERRYPRFAGGGMDRPGSRAGSIMSNGPTRVGTPNGFRPPPRTASRGAPDMNRLPQRNDSFDGLVPGVHPGLDSSPTDYGRPMPKTFQSNTIVPNKGLMVEDDDDEDISRDVTGGGAEAAELRAQVEALERKVDDLEGDLRDKDNELKRVQSGGSAQDKAWADLQAKLESKVREAQDLNSNLQAELERVRGESLSFERSMRDELDDTRQRARELERDLRMQLEETKRDGVEKERELRTQLSAIPVASRSGPATDGEYEFMERELMEQKQITEEVRRDAAQFLQEMRELSQQSSDSMEKEERLLDQVSVMEREIRDWKARYARLKSQNRSLRASTMGLPGINGDVSSLTGQSAFTSNSGLIKDVHVTNYQLAIDELLHLARKSDTGAMIECMKHVVVTVRHISADVDSLGTPGSSLGGSELESAKEHARLRARLSQAANNLITASKAHASAAGLAPVSLVDAAASHLTAAVIDIIQVAKIKPSPSEELESPESDSRKPLPAPRGLTPTNFSPTSAPRMKGHVRNESSMGSSGGYSAYSRYSSRHSNNLSSPHEHMANGGEVKTNGLGINSTMGMVRENGLEEFKNFLDDSTALLVRSIQPLVNTVRSGQGDDQLINEYIRDISTTVEDIVTKTNTAVFELANSALKKHGPPVLAVLEQSRIELNQEMNSKDRLPPVAFRIARATKELVLRVDRIESGELTADSALPTDF